MKRKILVLCLLAILFTDAKAQVKLTQTTEAIPTYLVGNPELDPHFYTGRTYQGAAGHVYPYPMYDILTDERVERDYKYLKLENEYTQIGVLPEIGGRIFSASDKQTGYNFFYTQQVIRPALIGMIGSWISGGVEWNIPHHHRASSTLNAGYEIEEHPDGSKTIWIGETELRQRLKWTIGLTMYPGKSYVEASLKVQNRTPMMQTFLYWANVSVHSNKDYQVLFPPQTEYGTTHSKTQYSDWPFAPMRGKDGLVDNSWWANFPGSNSTFAVNYAQNHLVGYDHGKKAGTAHWANHHLVPGKKFFLWGTESVWNEMLTEEDGAYLELMVGAFSDNQPDYSWIGPNEIRETKQYWYPIKEIGGAKNVNLDAAVNVERKDADNVFIGFNTTSLRKGAKVVVKLADQVVFQKVIDIDPNTPFSQTIKISSATPDEKICAAIYDSSGQELISYTPVVKADTERSHPADRPKEPADYDSVEELLLAAQRIEQFHNSRIDPIPYYEEVLKRDSLDSRANVNMGIRYAKEAKWTQALTHLQRAYKRLTGLHYMPDVAKTGVIYHTNPKDGEMLYYLGVVSQALGQVEEAEAYYWKSAWYPGFQSASYLYLAQIYWKQGKEAEAIDAIDRSIALSANSTHSKFIKAHFLGKQGKSAEAIALLKENIKYDPVDFLSKVEMARLQNNKIELNRILNHMGIPLQESVEISTFYGGVGAYKDAVDWLDFVMENGTEYSSTPMQKNAVEPFTSSPLLNYLAGYYSNLAGDKDKAFSYYQKASSMSTDYFFPSRVEEKLMLEDVIKTNPKDAKAHYYLGNLLYFYNLKDDAISLWRRSVELNQMFGIAYRNLGFAAKNHLADNKLAAEYYHKAIASDASDPKYFAELDIIEEALSTPSQQRLALLEKNKKVIFNNDDATARYVNLLVENEKYTKALEILSTRHFRVWEGGQTVYTKFVDAHLLYGLKQLSARKTRSAIEHFEAAGTFPRNLETNELSTGPTVAKVAYFQGLAYKQAKDTEKAKAAFSRCIEAASSSAGYWGGNAEESKYYLAMSQAELGLSRESAKTIEELSLAQASVDVYSKFGEDGSSRTIEARNHYTQGLAKLAKGDKSGAKVSFQRAVELDPSNVWAKYYFSTTK